MPTLTALLISIFSGAYDSSLPQKEMRKHTTEVQRCYQLFTDKGTGAKGVIVLKWKINDHGKAIDAAIDTKKTTLKDNESANCLLDLVKSIRFPEAEDGKTVLFSYRFTFK